MPAIVHAAASVDPGLLTLTLERAASELETSLVLGNGTHLDQKRAGGDSWLRSQSLPITEAEQAQLAAALAAGSTQEAKALLAKGEISFVLLVAEDVEIQTSLDSSGLLESAGATERGRLWRVKDAVLHELQSTSEASYVWFVGAIFTLYLLLSIPTPGSARRGRQDASIFVEEDER